MRFKAFRLVFNSDEAAAGATPAAPVEPAPVATQPISDGPWAKDIEAAFADESVRGQVDQFIRDRLQPHITRLEQDTAPARALHRDLVENPVETLGAIVAEIWGNEDGTPNEALANKVLELIQAGASPDEAIDAVAAANPPAAPALAPEDRELLDGIRAQKQNDDFESQLQAKRDATGSEFTRDGISPYIVAADGDIDKGYDMMVAYEAAKEAEFKAKYGIADETPVPTPAPAALGSSDAGTGTPAPPTQEKIVTFDDAFDSFAEDMRRARESAPATI